MTTSELLENEVKNSSGKNGGDIGFELSADADAIAVRVSNSAGSLEDYEVLSERIRRTVSRSDLLALYLHRYTQLMEIFRTNKTGLVVYRIAYEGRFTLSCFKEDGMVYMTAVRKL